MTGGLFISLEGGEGVGKSTQARFLAAALRERGREVIETREPGGSAGAERIRALLLDPQAKLEARAEALLFAAARADHVAAVIRPALERGAAVVSDRFLHSSLAYQGHALGLGLDAIEALHAFGSEGLLPDRVVLLEAADAICAERLRLRDGDHADRIGARPASYHLQVREGFRLLAARDPERVRIVDAGGAAETVAARVLDAVGPLA